MKTVTALFFFLMIATTSATQAQTLAPVRHLGSHPVDEAKNVGSAVHYVSDINMEAKASPLKISINGPYAELKPVLAPSGKRLYFSRSKHPENTFGEKDLEDIWYSEYSADNGAWSDPIRMAGELNNEGPNYINTVSVTGDTIILGNQYRKNGKMRAGVSYSVNVRGHWSVPMNIEIENDYNIADHSNTFVSLKAGVIIRAVRRCETYGERDLYVSFWNGEQATEPINMGGVINTDLEESSPFLDADTKTLYFASKGHNGLGGFDIWVTKRLDDTWTNWSEPENLGPAVNGSLDDEFFSITHCGKMAVFSKQVSIHNTDLYRISTEELFNNKAEPKKLFNQDEKTAVAALASL